MIATVRKRDASRLCNGAISRRVEIELNAGSIVTVGPSPQMLRPISMESSPHRHDIRCSRSSCICRPGRSGRTDYNTEAVSGLARGPFDPIAEFKGEYRCVAADLRNANPGQSSGPLEIDRPWDLHTDDQLGVMDHLGIDKFMVMGFCIGGPLVWNLLKQAPNRVVATVLARPSGFRPEMPNLSYENNMTGWGPELVKRRADITMDTVDKFLTKMYRANPDFRWQGTSTAGTSHYRTFAPSTGR